MYRRGVWGWTDMENVKERPAKLKYDEERCLCFVTKKPRVTFTIVVYTTHKGKQDWTETARIGGVSHLRSSVYVSSAIANLSESHETRRYNAWKTALTSYFAPHYEDAVSGMTAPTCDALKTAIMGVWMQANHDFWGSPEGIIWFNTQVQIGQEQASAHRVIHQSFWSGVYVEYE